MCIYNTCGLADKTQCPDKLSCCHKAFAFLTDGRLSTTVALKCKFYRNPEVTDINDTSGQSPLVMAWDCVVKFSDWHPKSTRAYHYWKLNILHRHMKDYQFVNKLPFTLWYTKEIKITQEIVVKHIIIATTFQVGEKEP